MPLNCHSRPHGLAELAELFILCLCQEDDRRRPGRVRVVGEEGQAERQSIVQRGRRERGLELVLSRQGEEEGGASGRDRHGELRPD